MKEFNSNELSKYTGKDGQPAYIAFKGKVYDVSDVFQDAEHGGVKAGTDITETFGNMLCPHQETVFEKFNQVGTLS